jgi:hypothetical protein
VKCKLLFMQVTYIFKFGDCLHSNERPPGQAICPLGVNDQ